MQILEIDGFEVLERDGASNDVRALPVLAFGAGFIAVENPLNPAAPLQLQWQWCAIVFDDELGVLRPSPSGNRLRRKG